MTRQATPGGAPIRLLFELAREDNPRLYDDLMRFNKGPKRVNRLRFLAHEGLLAQHWLLVPPQGQDGRGPGSAPEALPVDPRAARQTLQAFEAPAPEDEP